MHAETRWSVRIDFDLPSPPTDDDLIGFTEQLAAHHAAVAPVDGNRLSATMSLPSGTVRQAAHAGIAAVENAGVRLLCRATTVGVEVIDEEAQDRRLSAPLIPALASVADVAKQLRVSKQRVAQLAEQPGFPPPVAVVGGAQLRLQSHVDAWAQRWDRTPGRRPKSAAVG